MNETLDQYYRYKKRIARLILSDKKCVDLITNADYGGALPAEALLEQTLSDGAYTPGQVHLYDYIPDAETTADTHICIEVDDAGALTEAVGSYKIEINIIVPTALMNIFGGIRRDALASRIDYLINGEKELGFGRLKRVCGGVGAPSAKFRSRKLAYTVLDWNMRDGKLSPS